MARGSKFETTKTIIKRIIDIDTHVFKNDNQIQKINCEILDSEGVIHRLSIDETGIKRKREIVVKENKKSKKDEEKKEDEHQEEEEEVKEVPKPIMIKKSTPGTLNKNIEEKRNINNVEETRKTIASKTIKKDLDKKEVSKPIEIKKLVKLPEKKIEKLVEKEISVEKESSETEDDEEQLLIDQYNE